MSTESTGFQIISDLHLEINQQYSSFEIPACAKFLILAGDVGRLADYDAYRDFIQQLTARFELVFLVLGNHEFYNGTFAEGLRKAEALERDPSLNGRLVVLHRRQFDIPGTRVSVLGCTLWSDVPDQSKDIVRAKVKDFQRIEGWTVDDHNANHKSDHSWLVKEIESIKRANEGRSQNETRFVLVVTHHAPLTRGTSKPQYEGSPWSCAFGTDVLPHLSAGVDTWMFGHTHYSTGFQEEGVRVVSNQRGYVLPWHNSTDASSGFDVRRVLHM
ncbi:putative calcineurin-like phosphoesterase [Aspergillus steynii IBT 23096]|uniref:Putative calcineurin-like phosphoesterase n=1 Tax=Aspergillus steynii IBT 23096 TaxID=1392250 RepID=A0A2I2GKZ8_9EURO|nr:putative calcineurin-like phosphoesterase [Aspergillus steynii IBT 23096]PLB53519.1 putative calcineurin-like phosphoesterase [Aspergillus steynii IBT 23096]